MAASTSKKSVITMLLRSFALQIVAILFTMTSYVVKSQDFDDEEEVKEEEEPTLLDHPMFAYLDTTSWEAIWVVFSIMFGTVIAGANFQFYKWFIDVLTLADYNIQ